MPGNTAALSPLTNFHHVAYRCRDAAETRAFYEGVLGLQLAIALDFTEVSGTDAKLEYMHLFFRLEDGNFIAFFDAPDSVRPDHFKKQSGFNRHLAFYKASAIPQARNIVLKELGLEPRYIAAADEGLAWDQLPDDEPFTHMKPLR